MQPISIWGLRYSPWTERALFALDAKKVPYRFHRYQPILGEIPLKLKSKHSGRLTVPVAETEHGWLFDSLEIVRYADRVGAGDPLFSKLDQSLEETVRSGLDAARSFTTQRIFASEATLLEYAPPSLPKLLAGPMAKLGMTLFSRKYALDARNKENDRSALSRAFETVKPWMQSVPDALSTDVLWVTSLVSGISPHGGIRMTDNMRAAFTDTEACTKFSWATEWRDAVYDRYRNARAGEVRRPS